MGRDIFFGSLQGLTEFLPVSSSGHLQIFKHLFKDGSKIDLVQATLTYDVFLHFGTLLAVLIVFRKKLSIFICWIPWLLKKKIARQDIILQKYFWLIVLGNVPIFIAGYFLKDALENFSSIMVVGLGYLVSSIFLLTSGLSRFDGKQKKKSHLTGVGVLDISWRFALLVGLAQTVAIVPGVSRSGITIATALMLGASRRFAGEFSFLLSIPAITGAFTLSLLHLDIKEMWQTDLLHYGVGCIAAFLVGLLALKLLLGLVEQGRFYFFGFYTLVLMLFLFLSTSINKTD